MTEKPKGQRKPAGQFAWLWMIVSLISVGGFLAWLGVKSEASTVAVVEETEDEAGDASTAEVVTLEQLQAGSEPYVGRMIRVEHVSVASRLGERAFWTMLPNGTPYLVKLAAGAGVEQGEVVTVVGRVAAMSDSVLAAWQQEGVLTDDGQRAEAEFATNFVDAVSIERPAAPAGSAGAH